MKLSLIAAIAKNRVIGKGEDIPWQAEGEQLLFKALTYHQWILVGRKTFESMGVLPGRKYAVVSKTGLQCNQEKVNVFSSMDEALNAMAGITDHLIVAGGGEVYRQLIEKANTLHISVIECEPEGDVLFPTIPNNFVCVFQQEYHSNINYTYQIWQREGI